MEVVKGVGEMVLRCFDVGLEELLGYFYYFLPM